MSNTLTNLIPDVYAALDVVSRELVGFIPSVARNSSADRIALNQTLRVFQTPTNTAGENITPAMALPSASNQTIANKTVTLAYSRAFPFSWSGEEQYAMNTGPGYLNIRQDQIAQALRAACNEIESFVATTAYKAASRAYGTAGTTPFASDVSASAQLRKILDDNGAPASGRSLIINTSAGASLRTLEKLTKVNEAGTGMTLRDGELLNLHGFSIKESAQVVDHTAGTGASATTNTAGYAVGDTVITLASAGTGTIVAGDVITIQGDTNKYTVVSGDTDVSNGGTITIAAPGLRKAIAASAKTITVAADHAANVAFTQNAIVLATRVPALPPEGDIAIAREVITDPRSGLSFELAVYPGYRMNRYEIGINYGATVIKPEHAAVLLG